MDEGCRKGGGKDKRSRGVRETKRAYPQNQRSLARRESFLEGKLSRNVPEKGGGVEEWEEWSKGKLRS